MGVAIFAGKWSIGPGNVLANLREKVREKGFGKNWQGPGSGGYGKGGKGFGKNWQSPSQFGFGKGGKGFGKNWQGPGQGGYGKGGNGEGFGTKVHVSIASKLDIRQQSA